MHLFVKGMSTMNRPRKDSYDPVRTSTDEGSDESSLLEKPGKSSKRRSGFLRRHGGMILTQVVLLTLYTLVMYLVATKVQSDGCKSQTRMKNCKSHYTSLLPKREILTVSIAPANDAVVWEERKFVLGDRIQEKSIYSGAPSSELDKAWHDLLNGERVHGSHPLDHPTNSSR
jgi:hypothetical protein